MDKDCYDNFTAEERISQDDVSILSAYHAYLTSYNREPTLSEFRTYFGGLVKQGLTPRLKNKIEKLPNISVSNYTGNNTITSEDVTILDSYQLFLRGNKNKKAKSISEFRSYHDAFVVLPKKKTRLSLDIKKLPKFKDTDSSSKKEYVPKKRRTENLLECGTLEYENLKRHGFLYNNREYVGASFGNGSRGKGNKQTFLPISKDQIKKAIEYRENEFLVYNSEHKIYEFKYNKSISLLNYPLIFKKGAGSKAYQLGLSFKKPIYVPRGSQIHFHCIQTKQMQTKKIEESTYNINEDTEIQHTGNVAFSENINSETTDFRETDWKGNLCGPIRWWYPLDKTRSIGKHTTTFTKDTIIYNMFSDLIYGGCSLSEKSAFEVRLLAFTISPPQTEFKETRRTPKINPNKTSIFTQNNTQETSKNPLETKQINTELHSNAPEIHTEVIHNPNNATAGVNVQFQNDISLVGSDSKVSDNTNLDKQDRDKAKVGINISFQNKNSLLSHIKIVEEVLKNKRRELFAESDVILSTPTPTHTPAHYLQPADAFNVQHTPTPTHTNPEYIQPNNSFSNPVPTYTNPEYIQPNNSFSNPVPTYTNPEYIQPGELQIPPTPTPTHTSVEYIQPKDKK